MYTAQSRDETGRIKIAPPGYIPAINPKSDWNFTTLLPKIAMQAAANRGAIIHEGRINETQ